MLESSKFENAAGDKLNSGTNDGTCIRMDRKHGGKRIKSWLPEFSTFPYNVFYSILLRGYLTFSKQ